MSRTKSDFSTPEINRHASVIVGADFIRAAEQRALKERGKPTIGVLNTQAHMTGQLPETSIGIPVRTEQTSIPSTEPDQILYKAEVITPQQSLATEPLHTHDTPEVLHGDTISPATEQKLLSYIEEKMSDRSRVNMLPKLRMLRFSIGGEESKENVARIIRETSELTLTDAEKKEMLCILDVSETPSATHSVDIPAPETKTNSTSTTPEDEGNKLEELTDAGAESELEKKDPLESTQEMTVPSESSSPGVLIESTNLEQAKNELIVADANEMSVDKHATIPAVETGEQKKNLTEFERQMEKKLREGEASPPSLEGALRERIASAREAYALESVKYKSALREKKSLFRKTMSDLGFADKQMPEPGIMKEFLSFYNAKEDYIEVKKRLYVRLHERDTIGPMTEVESKVFDKKITEEEEMERGLVQRDINESIPPLEKGIITISFEKWAKLPLPGRIAVSTALLTGGGLLFGSAGVVAGVAAGVYRGTRSLIGAVAAQRAGKSVDSILKKKAKKREEEEFSEYVKNFDAETFAEKERGAMEFAEREENHKKRDRLKKIVTMMAVGGAVNIGANMGMSHIRAPIHEVSTGKGSGEIEPVKASVPADIPPKVSPPNEISPAGTGAKLPPEIVDVSKHMTEIEPVQVELSSRGFIDTFDKLKAQLAEKYPDVSTAPAEAQHILGSSPEKLAIEYGFYKPNQEFQSAFGLKGESLVLDKDGSLVFKGAGENQVLFDAKGGVAHEYKGVRLDANTNRISLADVDTSAPVEPTSTISVPEVLPHPIAPENISSVHSDVLVDRVSPEIHHNAPLSLETPLPHDPLFDFDAPGGGQIHVSQGMGGILRQAYFNNTEMTVASNDVHSFVDIADGKMPLKPEYQFDPKFKDIRTAYNIMFEKLALQGDQNAFDYRMPIEYKGGRIMVLQKGDEVTALLNGQKIATGKIIEGKMGFQYDQSLGKGIMMKSNYELAFDKAKEMVNQKIGVFISHAKNTNSSAMIK